jgi:hypothetical protein
VQGESEAVERALRDVGEEARVPLFADSTSRLTCHVAWSTGPAVADLIVQGLAKYAAPVPPTFKLAASELLSSLLGQAEEEDKCEHYSLRVELAPGAQVHGDAQARQQWVDSLSSQLRSGAYKDVLRSQLYWLSAGGVGVTGNNNNNNKGGNLRRNGPANSVTTNDNGNGNGNNGWEAWLAPLLDGSDQCDPSSSLLLQSHPSAPVVSVEQLCGAKTTATANQSNKKAPVRPSCVLGVAAFLATQAPVLHVSLVPTTLAAHTTTTTTTTQAEGGQGQGPPSRRSLLSNDAADDRHEATSPRKHLPLLSSATTDGGSEHSKNIVPKGLSATRRTHKQAQHFTQEQLDKLSWMHSDSRAKEHGKGSEVEKRELDEAYVWYEGPTYGLDVLELWAAGVCGQNEVVQVSKGPLDDLRCLPTCVQ